MHLIEFEWSRCVGGFRIQQNAQTKVRYLESIGKRFVAYQPTKIPALFRRFADMPRSAEGMRDFANLFGLLHISVIGENAHASSDFDSLFEQHRLLSYAISLYEAGELATLVRFYNRRRPGDIQTQLRTLAGGKVSLVFVPMNLSEFLWLQFILHISSEAKILRCERCGLPFSVGTGTGRRETAKFCTDRCKMAAHRSRLKKATH